MFVIRVFICFYIALQIFIKLIKSIVQSTLKYRYIINIKNNGPYRHICIFVYEKILKNKQFSKHLLLFVAVHHNVK